MLLIDPPDPNQSTNIPHQALRRIGFSNALFKSRADTGQPVVSMASREPRARRKALGARASSDDRRLNFSPLWHILNCS